MVFCCFFDKTILFFYEEKPYHEPYGQDEQYQGHDPIEHIEQTRNLADYPLDEWDQAEYDGRQSEAFLGFYHGHHTQDYRQYAEDHTDVQSDIDPRYRRRDYQASKRQNDSTYSKIRTLGGCHAGEIVLLPYFLFFPIIFITSSRNPSKSFPTLSSKLSNSTSRPFTILVYLRTLSFTE